MHYWQKPTIISSPARSLVLLFRRFHPLGTPQ